MSYKTRKRKQREKAAAFEVGLIGANRELSQWPDTWEHRCYFSEDRQWCAKCWKGSLLDVLGEENRTNNLIRNFCYTSRYANDPHWSPLQDMYRQRYDRQADAALYAWRALQSTPPG